MKKSLMLVSKQKTEEKLQSVVCEWSKLYSRYDAALKEFNNTPKIIRWWRGIKEPCFPKFQSIVVVEDYVHDICIELRCWNRKLCAAVNANGKGFLVDLETDVRTPLLGSRGMDIDSEVAKIVEEHIDMLKKLSLS